MTPRLLALARRVLVGQPMADVGTDHGLLPCWLVEQGVVPWAVGTDVAPGPLSAARRRVGVDLRLGDGLGPLAPGEVATVVLAGMGGPSMAAILARGPAVLASLARLVTQPTDKADALRAFLAGHGWAPVDGEVVEERGRFYVTEAWAPGAHPWSEADLVLGPRVRRDAAFAAWLDRERARLARALRGARRGGRVPEHLERHCAILDGVRICVMR